MAYTKLVFTALHGDDEKYEIYGESKNSAVHRIIRYKLLQRKAEYADEAAPTFEWVIVDKNVEIPKQKKSQPAVNWLWELDEL